MSLASKPLLESEFEPEELYDVMLLLLTMQTKKNLDDIIETVLGMAKMMKDMGVRPWVITNER